MPEKRRFAEKRRRADDKTKNDKNCAFLLLET